MNKIIVFLCLFFTVLVLYINEGIPFSVYNCVEMEALNSLAHVAFGLGLGAFWMEILKRRALLLSFLCVIGWEIFEIVTFGGFMSPIDMILDIILGVGFAWMYLRWIK